MTQHIWHVSKFVHLFICHLYNIYLVYIGELERHSSSGDLGGIYTRGRKAAFRKALDADFLARAQCICGLLNVGSYISQVWILMWPWRPSMNYVGIDFPLH